MLQFMLVVRINQYLSLFHIRAARCIISASISQCKNLQVTLQEIKKQKKKNLNHLDKKLQSLPL